MENINWNAKQAQARKMTWDQLEYAYNDCRECVRCMGTSEMKGKDASYYSDEASVYYKEMCSRRAAAAKRLDGGN